MNALTRYGSGFLSWFKLRLPIGCEPSFGLEESDGARIWAVVAFAASCAASDVTTVLFTEWVWVLTFLLSRA